MIGTSGQASVGITADVRLRAIPDGLTIPVPESGTYSIKNGEGSDVANYALHPEDYDLVAPTFPVIEGNRDRLHLNINELGWISINIGNSSGFGVSPDAARTAADVALAINGALAADPRYVGVPAAASAEPHWVLAGFTTVAIWCNPLPARDASIQIGSGPADAAGLVFGYPRSLTTFAAPLSLIGHLPEINATDLSKFPLVDDRIEPGPATFNIIGTTSEGTFSYSGTPMFTSLDVGRYMRLFRNPGFPLLIDPDNIGNTPNHSGS